MSSRSLRIAMLADPYVPVPPRLYGGIERIISLLVEGLQRRGHEVHLVAHPESTASATLHPYGQPPHRGLLPRAKELVEVWRALEALRGRLDVFHSFARLAALAPVMGRRRVPKLQSYQRGRIQRWSHIQAAAALAGASLAFVGCSESVFAEAHRHRGSGRWHRVFNGVEVDRYPFAAQVAPDAPLVSLGRIEREKGVHHAIAIALRARRTLVIAGNIVRDGGEPDYFEREIAAHLDGTRCRYIGPVDDVQKGALLSTAAALLMPVEVDEAFGIVMAEALACGTPIIAFPRGAISEVVLEGVTGFIRANVASAALAVAHLGALDRRRAREDCVERFSADVIVEDYLSLYHEQIERCASSS